MNTIAKGFERFSDVEFKRFLYIAKASCGEIQSMLYLSKDSRYTAPENAKELRTTATQLAKIASLIKYLNASKFETLDGSS